PPAISSVDDSLIDSASASDSDSATASPSAAAIIASTTVVVAPPDDRGSDSPGVRAPPARAAPVSGSSGIPPLAVPAFLSFAVFLALFAFLAFLASLAAAFLAAVFLRSALPARVFFAVSGDVTVGGSTSMCRSPRTLVAARPTAHPGSVGFHRLAAYPARAQEHPGGRGDTCRMELSSLAKADGSAVPDPNGDGPAESATIAGPSPPDEPPTPPSASDGQLTAAPAEPVCLQPVAEPSEPTCLGAVPPEPPAATQEFSAESAVCSVPSGRAIAGQPTAPAVAARPDEPERGAMAVPVRLDERPSRGDPAAPVVLVEY